MKKLIAFILVTVLILTTFTGCDGIYKDIWQGPNDIIPDGPDTPGEPETPDDEETVFTVKIIFDDELFEEVDYDN